MRRGGADGERGAKESRRWRQRENAAATSAVRRQREKAGKVSAAERAPEKVDAVQQAEWALRLAHRCYDVVRRSAMLFMLQRRPRRYAAQRMCKQAVTARGMAPRTPVAHSAPQSPARVFAASGVVSRRAVERRARRQTR